MSKKSNKKIIIPKINKKIKWFLTDESWKITKQAALWLSAGSFLALWIEDTIAAGGWIWHSSYSHSSGQSCSAPSHSSGTSVNSGHVSGGWHQSGSFSATHSSSVTKWTVSWHGSATWHSSHGSSGTGSGCGSCFTFDQLVSTPQWDKNIWDIKVWDIVISYSEKDNEKTYSKVAEVLIHDGKNLHMTDYGKYPLIKIGISVNNKIIYTIVTENHPYYSPISDEYKQLKYFNIWDQVLHEEWKWSIVSTEVLIDWNSSYDDQQTIVYNLEMEKNDNHNYFVNGFLVHNATESGPVIKD